MSRSKKLRSIALLALLIAAAPLSAGIGIEQSASAVPVVRNGKRPAAGRGEARFSLEPLWSVGGGDSAEADFSQIAAVAIGAGGEAAVLDGKECRVFIFDVRGKRLRTFGRKGQGPGELSGPIGIAWTPGGEILVDDALNRRLSYFSSEGKPLRQVSTAQGMGMGLAGLIMDPRGRMAARTLFFEGGKIGFEIRVYDKDLKPGPPLGRVELGALGQGKFDPLTLMPGLVMASDAGGNIFLGSPAGYRINVFGFDGRPRRAIERAYDPVPVRKEDQARIMKMLGGMPATGGFSLKEMILIPAAFPAYSFFVVDPAGRILVRTFEKGKTDKEFYWDLFDAAGRYAARIPSAAELVAWRDGRIFGIQEDEDGFQVLKCFRVIE